MSNTTIRSVHFADDRGTHDGNGDPRSGAVVTQAERPKTAPITTNGRTYTAEPFPDEQPRAKPTLRATIRERQR